MANGAVTFYSSSNSKSDDPLLATKELWHPDFGTPPTIGSIGTLSFDRAQEI
jgi:hypothetical protein